MTNAQILAIAKEQSAADMNCRPEDFDKMKRKKIIIIQKNLRKKNQKKRKMKK